MKNAQIPYPPRVELACLPTPIQPLKRLGKQLGVELYVKRDDLTEVACSGNKIRKLEFSMADALAEGADTVITCGGAQSNHSRATAISAARLGLRCRLLLRTANPASPPLPQGNLLLDRLAGAEIVWITPEEYRRRDEFFAREAEALRREGRRPYIIPEGASNPVGVWGYIRAAAELGDDMARLPGGAEKPATVIHALGSGGTSAGFILGARLHRLNTRMVSINVCDDRAYFTRVIGEICESTIAAYHLDLEFDRQRDIEIIDGYVGRGYALSSPAELTLIREVVRTEGIFLDPVYTGKAFYGMVQELRRDRHRFGERIIFIHTGGIFALFAQAEEFVALL